MEEEAFKIYLDRLRGGVTEKIHEVAEPLILEVSEPDLQFNQPITIDGEAYLAESNLILHLHVSTVAVIPCAVCNAPVSVAITVDSLYHMEAIENCRGGVFYFKDIVREAILLETPSFAECNQGHCPQRQEIAKYLKNECPDSSDASHTGEYHPFADIDLDKFKPKN